MNTKDICKSLYYNQYHYRNEKDLQSGVELVLTGLSLPFKSEYRLSPRDRIDFFIEGIGIECKSEDSHGGTSLSSVTRQLMRYAMSSEINELILFTTMSKHRNLPDSINEKPLYIVHALLSFL